MILDDSNHRSLEFASCWNGWGEPFCRRSAVDCRFTQSYICPQSGLLGKNSDIWWSTMVVTSWCFVKSSVKTKFVFLSLPPASFFLPQRLGLHINLAPPTTNTWRRVIVKLVKTLIIKRESFNRANIYWLVAARQSLRTLLAVKTLRLKQINGFKLINYINQFTFHSSLKIYKIIVRRCYIENYSFQFQ